MIRFQPYQPADIGQIHTAVEGKIPPSVDELAKAAWSFTAREDDRIVGCGGILRVDPWRGLAWALFARGLPMRAMARIRRRCETVLRLAEADGIHCIEAEVALGYVGGHQFANALGFRFAGVLPGRTGDGGCFIRYVRAAAHVEQPPIRVRACLDLADRSLRDFLVLREAA